MKGAVAGEWLEIGVQQKVGRNEFSSMFLFLPLVLDCSNSFIVMQQEEVLSQCFLSLSVFPKYGVVWYVWKERGSRSTEFSTKCSGALTCGGSRGKRTGCVWHNF